jgi:lysine-arginine-ornithine-binding protein
MNIAICGGTLKVPVGGGGEPMALRPMCAGASMATDRSHPTCAARARLRETGPNMFFRLKLLLPLLSGLVLLPSIAAAKDWKAVRIATEGRYPPFNYVEPGKDLQGFEIDLARSLCDRLKVKCDFSINTRDGVVADLLAKKIDAIVDSLAITDERRQRFDFTDHYYENQARFVTSKSLALSDASPEALKGKAVGALSQSAQAAFLQEVYAPKGAKVRLYATLDEAGSDFAAGRLDAMLGDELTLYAWINKGEAGRCCQFAGAEVKNAKYFGDGIGIAVRKEDGDLRGLFNKALADMLRDGTYEKLNARYFPFSIY